MKWIVDNKIIEVLLGDSIHNEIIKRLILLKIE